MNLNKTARIVFFEELYRYELLQQNTITYTEDTIKKRRLKENAMEYLNKASYWFLRNKSYIDAYIKSSIKKPIDYARMSVVDKSILRIGITEMFYLEDIVPQITIKQMENIASIYSTENSIKFIGGVLRTVYEELTI